MSDTEKKDIYIAAAVGGLGLVLILLYMHAGTQTVQNGQELPAPNIPTSPAASEYNYNIAPYQPGPPITQPVPQTVGQIEGGGCCDTCGFGGTNVNVANYLTLLGTGEAA